MINFDIYTSLILSIVVQTITLIIDLNSLFIHVPPDFEFLKQMLTLEVTVQFVEGLFYMYWLFHFNTITNITPRRYYDWVFTTPTVLITLIFFLNFLKYREDNISDKLDFFELFNQEFDTIATVLLLNWLMLFFGFLGENNIIPVILGVALGFIPFLVYFYIIYTKYAVLTGDGLKIFSYFLIVWALYGVVAVLPYKVKNMCYNILDLFSKNFLGIFLSYLIFVNRG